MAIMSKEKKYHYQFPTTQQSQIPKQTGESEYRRFQQRCWQHTTGKDHTPEEATVGK